MQREHKDTVFIYGLACPKANVVRYVGQAISPYRRLMDHALRNDNPALSRWIAWLSCDGMMPRLLILEVATTSTVINREAVWIRHFYALHGEMLFNRSLIPQRRKASTRTESTAGVRASLAYNLRRLRVQAGRSVASVAHVAGITADALYRLERGERWITPETLDSLASALGTTPWRLVDTPTSMTSGIR